MDSSGEFIEFALGQGVLRFGEFKTKAGRLSPYFFDAGLFHDGASLGRLAEFYARAILASKVPFDMLFGPAYKGIPLAATTAIALAARGRNVPICYNRKETKNHGEGGVLIGARPEGQVLIIDDVISAGTSVRQSVDLIAAAGARPCGVVIALDRMERGQGQRSAAQEVRDLFGIPVISVANLDDLLVYLSHRPDLSTILGVIRIYRNEYGIAAART